MIAPEIIVRELGLAPHPEGGLFAETFRAPLSVSSPEHAGARAASTAIYFLLRAGEFSAFHRVRSDELWHFYTGDPLELHLIDAQGLHERMVLGPGLERGERPQRVVPAGVLQAARPTAGPHGYTLTGCTVAPGFEFSDFELPERAELLRLLPAHEGLFRSLCR